MENRESKSSSGETSEREQVASTIEALMRSGNKEAIIDNIRMYHEAGRGSRVSIFHENIEESGDTVIMFASIHDRMRTLIERTGETKTEHAFLILGEAQDGFMAFTGLASDLDISDEDREKFYRENPELKTNENAADLNIVITTYRPAINAHIDQMKEAGKRPLVALGHTHPNVTESFGNYSLPDLVGFPMQERALRGSSRGENEFDYCHVVLAENGDVDCMVFDKEKGCFRKIVDVLAISQDGEDRVQAYSFKSPSELTGASYVRENGESATDAIYDSCIEEILQEQQ